MRPSRTASFLTILDRIGSVKVNWRLILWLAVFYWILVTGPYWWQRWQELDDACNPRLPASCEP